MFVSSEKIERPIAITHGQSFVNAFNDRVVRHRVEGQSAKVRALWLGAIEAPTGDYTVSCIILKNGATIMQSAPQLPPTLDGTHSDYEEVGERIVENGTYIADTDAVKGDLFEFQFTASGTTGTAAKGVFATLVVVETGGSSKEE